MVNVGGNNKASVRCCGISKGSVINAVCNLSIQYNFNS